MSSNLNPQHKAMADAIFSASPVLHPDYIYWADKWRMIRDADLGEVEIKRQAQKYLPKLQGHDANQYAAYLHRAVFFNMTAKTLNALYGTMFRRNPKTTLPKSLLKKRRFSKDGMSLHLTAKTAAKEVLSVARFGMLVDADPDGKGDAYVACYTAENIMDWQLSDIDGEWKFSRVVLREISYNRLKSPASPYEYTARYRVLTLTPTIDGYVYEQHVFEDKRLTGAPDLNGLPDEIITPTVRGEVLSYIPFQIIGPFTNHPDVQKPPILDIVTLNFSHYLSYAQLEQGRFYTANPVYTVSSGSNGGGGEAPEYYVGPDVVWELGQGGQAKILEFNGHGLNSLEKALTTKEAQISAIGGRMMAGASAGAAESDNALKLKEQNEQTLLLNIADTMDEGFTNVLRWWADWNNVPSKEIEKIVFEVNRDFLMKDIGAREFRAIHQMYADGIIPVEVVFEYLRKAEVVPDWMDADEFKQLLTDSKQFPNMVDVLARMKGFPDAKSEQDIKLQKEQFAHDIKMAKSAVEVAPSPGDPNMPGVPKQAKDATAAEKERAPKPETGAA